MDAGHLLEALRDAGSAKGAIRYLAGWVLGSFSAQSKEMRVLRSEIVYLKEEVRELKARMSALRWAAGMYDTIDE